MIVGAFFLIALGTIKINKKLIIFRMMQDVLTKSHSLSPKMVCQNIVETIIKVFNVDLAILSVEDPLFVGNLISPQIVNRKCFYSYKSTEIFSDIEQQFFQQIVIFSETVLAADDLTSDYQWLPKLQLLPKEKVRSLLAVPLPCQHGIKACLNLYSCQQIRTWLPEEVGLAVMMAAQAGLAISQARAYEEMKALAQKELTLNRINSVIRSSLEPQVIYNSIVKELGLTLGVAGCALSLWTAQDRYMNCVAFHNSEEKNGIPQETQDWQRSTISLVPIAENPILQQLITRKKTVCLSDLRQEQHLARFDLPWRSQSRALLVVPLLFDGEIMGSITLREENISRTWRDSEIELAESVASHAAIAVSQAKLYETTRRQAIQLQISENRVKELNNYLTESILKRFLPEAIANKAATGKLALDLHPEPHLVTILFADLVGFTKLSSQIEADTLSELLNDYLEAMTQVVFDYSGTIDKFVGDGIMALFGAPEEISPQQQANRAIATAQAMQRNLAPINHKWQQKGILQANNISALRLRCGIHQGMAIVGMFGGKQRKDYTAIGKVVNIAARLQQIAQPNTILLSETVFDSWQHSQELAVVPRSLQLKGIEPDFLSYALAID